MRYRLRIRSGLVLALVFLLGGQAMANGDSSDTELALPGLQADADAFEATLRRPFTSPAASAALTRARSTARKDVSAANWVDALPALETLVGGTPEGTQAGADIWLLLARAELGQSPPIPVRALQAAWMAFTHVDGSRDTALDEQVAALRIMHDALVLSGRPVAELKVLAAIARRRPDDKDAQEAVRARQLALGLLLEGVTTDAEAFPARACLRFLGRLSDDPDFHPGDWVRLSPSAAEAAVTREAGQLCITGVAAGATTIATIQAGMPGAPGLSLKSDLRVPLALPDRKPRLVFDGARYLQPRDARATVALDTVNLSAVRLVLVRIDERNLLHVMQTYPPGQGGIGSYAASDLAQNQGRVVWSGKADVPSFRRNALRHVVLPLPPALDGPGLYALLASPADGTPFAAGDAPGAVQLVLRTDLAPTVWRGADGDTVQVRSFSTGLPVADVAIELVAADNEILGHAATDADGLARFARPLLAGANGLAPASLHLRGPGDDFTRLDLTTPDFDLSDRGVGGAPQPGPIDAFLWTDRGIYRPGETVQVMALPRDAAGVASNLPLHLVVTRPNGRVFSDTVPKPLDGGAIHAAVALSSGAQYGTWTIALRAVPDGPSISERSIEVNAFVPPRLAVEFPQSPASLAPGRTTALPVAVRFLYGAPGAALSGRGAITLQPDPMPFADYKDYRFGLADESFTGRRSEVELDATDEAGRTTLPIDLGTLPDVSTPLKASVEASINDPAGRSVAATATVPIRPAAALIGIVEDFVGEAVDAGAAARFRLVALDPDGKRIAMKVQIRLVRQEPDWRLAVRNGQARYETVWRDEPVDQRDVTLPADGAPLPYGRTLPFGRYKLTVLQATGGLAASSAVFSSGWAMSDDPDVPARVSVRADKRQYRPGDTATIHIEAPFAGPATVLVMTDRVKHLIDVPAGGRAFDVPVAVGADWGPGAYVGVHLFRPGGTDGGTAPDRAIGLTWVSLDPTARTLPLAVAAEPVERPRETTIVTVRTSPGAWVTLAAVDEGILSLTGFKTPDPLGYFFGKRTLAVGIHDDWARLLPPAGPADTTLREGGGGDLGGGNTTIPQVIASLFAGPVQAGADGIARIPLALPDFAGALRLMAVGWDGARTNSASLDVIVRDRLIAEPLLPRFLAPGDVAEAGVLLQNLELPAGTVSVHLAASGALALGGGDPSPAILAPGARAVLPVRLVASGAGPGTLSIDATGPDGFHVTHQATIAVHPARGTVTAVTALSVPPDGAATLVPADADFLPGTWHGSASLGLGVRYDPASLVRALRLYPLDCLEQLTSRGLPLATMADGGGDMPDRAGQLEHVTEAVLDRQRFDGGFGLWSSADTAEPWLSAYATDFLLRAQAAGAVVPPTALNAALGFLASEVASPPDDPAERASQAYALYVLSLAGKAPAGAVRVAASTIDEEPTPLARAQIAASLARLGEATQARAAFGAVLASPARKDWAADDGSALRDQFATAVLAHESGVMDDRLPEIRARLPGADLDPASLSTQEQAWAATAAYVLSRGGTNVSVIADGRRLGPAPRIALAVERSVTLRNPGPDALPASLVVDGVPRAAPPAAHAGMEVHRHFFALDGTALEPDKLSQNTVFVMVLDGRATDAQDHQASVLAGLPAGWEIAGRFPSGAVAGMGWLGTLSDIDAEAAGDDRYAVALRLSRVRPDFRLAVMLRAVTPGDYEYPGITVADMYRPAVFARQGTVRVSVVPPATPPK